MTTYQEYNSIYEKEIVQKSKGIIFSFPLLKEKHSYQPFCHAISNDAVEKLGALIRHNLFFYAFGEDEIIEYYKNDMFSSIESAAKYAYKNMLPHRAPKNDGLPGEALLDLLIQLYNPNAYKLAVRTILRQNDNNEIKGYDLTYFTKEHSCISVWLGQAKLGDKSYCKNGINKDLLEKYISEYLANQLYFVCSKRFSITDDAKTILKAIERINIRTIDDNDANRAKQLIDLFNILHIQVKIPCLLAYEESGIYQDSSKLYERLIAESEDIKTYFNNRPYSFIGFSPEIVFYVFPIESIDRLRDKENDFYAGLC